MKHIKSFNEGKDNKELNKKITNAYKFNLIRMTLKK